MKPRLAARRPTRTAVQQRDSSGFLKYGRDNPGNRVDPPEFDADKALALMRITLAEVYGS